MIFFSKIFKKNRKKIDATEVTSLYFVSKTPQGDVSTIFS